jgi:lysophospholipase L1-like esterase
MKSWLANAVLILGTLVVMAGVLEAMCRTVIDTGLNYHIEMWKYATQVKRIADNPEVGHEHRPGVSARLMSVDVAINHLGLRNAEVGEKRNGTTRILMLGDSVTFGWGVPQDQTMSAVLGRRLAESRPVEVINTGVGNYNTAMEVAYFRTRGVQLAPDLVILNFFINDAEPTPVYRDVPWYARHAYLYPVVGGAWDGFQRRLAGEADWQSYYAGLYEAPGWQRAQDSIRTLAELCRERGIPLVIANLPELRILAPYPFGHVSTQLAGLAAEIGAAYVDLLPAVAAEEPARLWVTVPDPHPNAVAHQLMGDALAAFIAPRLP